MKITKPVSPKIQIRLLAKRLFLIISYTIKALLSKALLFRSRQPPRLVSQSLKSLGWDISWENVGTSCICYYTCTNFSCTIEKENGTAAASFPREEKRNFAYPTRQMAWKVRPTDPYLKDAFPSPGKGKSRAPEGWCELELFPLFSVS